MTMPAHDPIASMAREVNSMVTGTIVLPAVAAASEPVANTAAKSAPPDGADGPAVASILSPATSTSGGGGGHGGTGGGTSAGGQPNPPAINLPVAHAHGLPTQQATGLATQAVAQSMAIAVQDAVDLLRNISTIETTAIGAATAKWIAEPENVFYPTIIATSTETLSKVADILKTIGANTAAVLGDYESRS